MSVRQMQPTAADPAAQLKHGAARELVDLLAYYRADRAKRAAEYDAPLET